MDKKKIKIIALFGESGSGKDTLAEGLKSLSTDYHRIVNCTTRAIRENETDGIDYHFLTTEQFGEYVLNGEMIEATDFNGWFYGTQFSALDADKINIGVFNISAIDALLQDPRLRVIPIYICVNPKERLVRALRREDNPDCHEICRRFLADEKDFDDIDFDYQYFKNEDFRSTSILMLDDLIKTL